jgi:hypothetical protein
MPNHQIFISYSHIDSSWVQQFAEQLEKLGLTVWLDRLKITPGSRWDDALEAGLRGSDIYAFLIHPDKLDSPWFSFELGAALATSKIIIPIVPQGLELQRLPAPLRRIQWLERGAPEETAKKFAQAVEALSQKAA